ncbi:TPA: hypothetical protein ACPZCB_003311 [Yersinia enterocolitica]|uniref:hypothetical protein n=1 Tax=Yersinia TaxID=629 RepID=UPI001BAF72CF|nr:hypothetical protein [Yersinia sp. Marseille-Q3913]EKN5943034.1 hypothetical protein [Yersinia enterocolitica]ELZ0585426.1 hypothetical protein [Yersinia enterocolitica]MBS0054219.1 hypothetical protein [Yersinia sp. Marseille-Q3913]HDL7852037.1 hypothetical protein [Yersinia enterocolitica]HDL7935865.1 hypothetical protein [Yersinia enterocolitica]
MIFKLQCKIDNGHKWWWELINKSSEVRLKGLIFTGRHGAIRDLEKIQTAIEKAPLVSCIAEKIDEIDLYPEITALKAPVVFIFNNRKPDVWDWQAIDEEGNVITESAEEYSGRNGYKTCEEALIAAKKTRESIACAPFVDAAGVPISPAVLSKDYCERRELVDNHPAAVYWRKRDNR